MQCFLYNNCTRVDCENDFCLKRTKMAALYDAALITPHLRKHIKLTLLKDVGADVLDIEAYKQLDKISKNIMSFVENGNNLFIHSSTSGNGKTSWSLRLVESYFNNIWIKSDICCRALFISVPRFLIALKEEINNPGQEYITHIKANILKADLVIWDDIAAKVGTEFEINQLLSYIDARISSGKSNIYTSNLNAVEMSHALEQRLASRVCGLSKDIELVGVDKRFLGRAQED